MLVNGHSAGTFPIDDRGLAYGDGVFETIRCINGRPILWAAHLARLQRGCDLLGIKTTGNQTDLMQDLTRDRDTLFAHAPDDAILKLIVTRGQGGNGYAPPLAQLPNRMVSVRAYSPDQAAIQDGIHVSICETRLGINPGLAGVKHLNRLEQVLGAAEIKEGSGEGLMLDINEQVIEGTRSNVFFVRDGQLITPDLDRCGVHGTLRAWLLATETVEVLRIPVTVLASVEEMFTCNSVYGIYPVTRLSGRGLERQLDIGARTRGLQSRLRELGFRSC
ncbi:MAG: aminodeoxychorismate lyase [Pseudomonadales bacterium]